MTGMLLLLAACRAPAPTAPDPVWEELVAWTEEQRQVWQVPGIALALARHGEPVRTAGLGVASLETGEPVTGDTLFRAGSLSKLVTGVLALQALERGELDLDTPMSKLLPDLDLAAPHELADVSVEALFSHSSGLQSTGVPNQCDTGPTALGDTLAERVPDWDLWVEPDTLFQYSNPSYTLAGHALERLAHVPYTTLAIDRVLGPAGAATATYDPAEAEAGPWALGHSFDPATWALVETRDLWHRACGAAFPSGGLIASAQDLGQLVATLLGDGQPWLDPEAFAVLTTTGWALTDTSSYGWGLLPSSYRDHPIWFHTGSLHGYQAILAVLPEDGVGFAVLVNSDHAVTDPPEPWSKPTQRIALEAFDRLLGLPAEAIESAVRPQEEWSRFEGVYRSHYELGELAVTLDEDGLWLTRRETDEREVLVPYGEDSFLEPYVSSEGLTYWSRYAFVDGDDGEPAWLTTKAGIAARVE